MDSPTPVHQRVMELKAYKSGRVVISEIGKLSSHTSVSSSSGQGYGAPQEVSKELPAPVTQPRERPWTTTTRRVREQVRRGWEYFRWMIWTTYRQLWLLVVAVNLAAIIVVVSRNSRKVVLPLASPANAAVANLLGAVLVRQDYMKNIMYHTCWSVPHSAPLWLRKRLAIVYENGGAHSGAAVSALLWFAVFSGSLWTNFARGGFGDAVVLTFDLVLTVLLLAIVAAALPQVRRRHHNVFENTHRWAGWGGIGLFWIAIVLFARDEAEQSSASQGYPKIGLSLVKLPAFWMLVIITAHVIYPWVLLRRVQVDHTERLSDHATRIYFSTKENIPRLHGCAISDSPVHEWHGFAAIPDLEGTDGGCASVIVSKAGDWTSKTIESPASYYYMRGIHATGVLGMAQVFRSVIIMATGSGIGPCLAVVGQIPQTKMRLIWSTPSPRAIFGDKICDRVLKEDPEAIIWDTRLPGQKRPDLIQIGYDMYTREGAEAVFFISNRKLTRRVIKALRQKGVPAYAPVFDS